MTIYKSVSEERIPNATVARLPVYLRFLSGLLENGVRTCDSVQLAQGAGVSPAMIRKDLSFLGSFGTRGVGYDVELLVFHIGRVVGQTKTRKVIIVGAGNLGSALGQYAGFESRGISVSALFDSDLSRIGTMVGRHKVLPVSDLPKLVKRNDISIAVIATPAAQAQEVADLIVAAGITSILDFAPQRIQVPDHVQVRRVDLAVELQILAYHEQRRTESGS